MSRYNGGWSPYVSVAQRRAKAEREMQKLRKQGHSVAPVIIAGRMIAATFWGKAWCENLESYHDYESRLPRGRSYVRNGSVVDLQIAPLAVTALVSGSSIYNVTIRIMAVPRAQWRSICRDCTGLEMADGKASAVWQPDQPGAKPSAPKTSRSVKPASKQRGARKPAQPTIEPVETVLSAKQVRTKPTRRADKTAEPAPVKTAMSGKPRSKKAAGPPAVSKTTLQLTPDGFVKWWK
jgi:hypothetical protein